MWEYANNLNKPTDRIMNYVMIINICKPKIIDKLNFLREHTQIFNYEIAQLMTKIFYTIKIHCIKNF